MRISELYQECLFALLGAIDCDMLQIDLAEARHDEELTARWARVHAEALRVSGQRGLSELFIGDIPSDVEFLSQCDRNQFTIEVLLLLHVFASVVRFPGHVQIFRNVVLFLSRYRTNTAVWRTLFLARCPNAMLDALSKLDLSDKGMEELFRAPLHVIFLNGSGMKPYLLALANSSWSDAAAVAPCFRTVVTENINRLELMLSKLMKLARKDTADAFYEQAMIALLFSLLSYSNVCAAHISQRCLKIIQGAFVVLETRRSRGSAEARDVLCRIVRALVNERRKWQAPPEHELCFEEFLRAQI